LPRCSRLPCPPGTCSAELSYLCIAELYGPASTNRNAAYLQREDRAISADLGGLESMAVFRLVPVGENQFPWQFSATVDKLVYSRPSSTAEDIGVYATSAVRHSQTYAPHNSERAAVCSGTFKRAGTASERPLTLISSAVRLKQLCYTMHHLDARNYQLRYENGLSSVSSTRLTLSQSLCQAPRSHP
jgi:hypothetical protein